MAAFQVGAHSLSGGALSAMQGGNFWQGLAAGGLSSAVSSGIAALDGNGVVQIGGAALSGGLSSEIMGGDFWRGAATGATVAGLNHLRHSSSRRIMKLLAEYNGLEHPGKLNLKGRNRNVIAAHLLRGIKYHMTSKSDIDLNKLFACLSTECLKTGGTHLLSRQKQSWLSSFLGPSGDLFAPVYVGDKNIKVMYEIPFHGPNKGLVFGYHDYQHEVLSSNGNWAIRWGGLGGLFLNFRNHRSFIRDWILER
ncbi:hypothetical protein FKX85_16600 [Echinicola soli]|uniref:Uncharacterized protein n=1 Tax=Echinicola soli TaxID=2591634 RepID=A0A514CL72_9BACT|nr:hypothetical protein [Echinicola soli]QDH80573.1 hypothetical protein FKX85_16600 [Echinicola soli]